MKKQISPTRIGVFVVGAIALAVANDTPIFVEDHVLDQVAGPGQPGPEFTV